MKKQKIKKKLKPKAGSADKADKKALMFFEYEVSYEPVKNESYEIPREIDARMQELYDTVHKTPKKAIPILEELKVKYPHVPQIYNFLSVAHSIAGEIEKATEAIRENYRKNPDYLFAKINYAELCLNNEKFDYKLLKKLAPDHNFTKRLRLKLLVKSFKKNLNLP